MSIFFPDKALIVAELSANHGGSLEVALDTITAAKQSGADAIKLQTYTADTITLDSDAEDFVIQGGTLWDGRKLHDLYDEAHTPWEWHEALFAKAKEEGLICFSSPFDQTAVDFLEAFNTPAYKIASFEITDVNLIRYAAQKNKPMIISTGIANQEDIELAIAACREVGNNDITLLKCTSAYPAPIDLVNLNTMVDMKQKYGVEVGLSDHTTGLTAPVVAATLGAKMIEKHFILDRSLGGPDASFSLEPADFGRMVQAVRNAEASLGEVTYGLDESIKSSRQFARSLYVAEEIKKGDFITEQNVRSVRPGNGLHPKYLQECLGKKSNRDLEVGTPFSLEFLA